MHCMVSTDCMRRHYPAFCSSSLPAYLVAYALHARVALLLALKGPLRHFLCVRPLLVGKRRQIACMQGCTTQRVWPCWSWLLWAHGRWKAPSSRSRCRTATHQPHADGVKTTCEDGQSSHRRWCALTSLEVRDGWAQGGQRGAWSSVHSLTVHGPALACVHSQLVV